MAEDLERLEQVGADIVANCLHALPERTSDGEFDRHVARHVLEGTGVLDRLQELGEENEDLRRDIEAYGRALDKWMERAGSAQGHLQKAEQVVEAARRLPDGVWLPQADGEPVSQRRHVPLGDLNRMLKDLKDAVEGNNGRRRTETPDREEADGG